MSEIRLPETTDDVFEPMSDKNDEAVIVNPYPGKEVLTPIEAIDAINRLSATLLVHGRIK